VAAKALLKDLKSKQSKAADSKDFAGKALQNIRISKKQEYLTSELAKMKEVMDESRT